MLITEISPNCTVNRTRKPTWCKCKRATAVHVRRPLAKKSTVHVQQINIHWRFAIDG